MLGWWSSPVERMATVSVLPFEHASAKAWRDAADAGSMEGLGEVACWLYYGTAWLHC